MGFAHVVAWLGLFEETVNTKQLLLFRCLFYVTADCNQLFALLRLCFVFLQY